MEAVIFAKASDAPRFIGASITSCSVMFMGVFLFHFRASTPKDPPQVSTAGLGRMGFGFWGLAQLVEIALTEPTGRLRYGLIETCLFHAIYRPLVGAIV